MLRRLVRLPLRLRPPRRPRAVAKAVALFLGLLVLAEALRVLVGTNRHAVIPGKVYRSNQPSPDGLRDATAELGIRTVINLRGYGGINPNDWYPDEARVTSA